MCRVTIGHLRVTIGHLRETIGHLKDGEGHFRVTLGHFRITINYRSLLLFLKASSQSKANLSLLYFLLMFETG